MRIAEFYCTDVNYVNKITLSKPVARLISQKAHIFIVQFKQVFFPHIYIILENSEFCNKVLTISKKIAILYVRSGKAPEHIETEKQKGVVL